MVTERDGCENSISIVKALHQCIVRGEHALSVGRDAGVQISISTCSLSSALHRAVCSSAVSPVTMKSIIFMLRPSQVCCLRADLD